MIYVVRAVLLCFVEVICMQLLLDTFLQRKTYSTRFEYLSLLVLYGTTFGISFIEFGWVKIIIFLMAYFLFARIRYLGKWFQIVFSTLAAYVLLLLLDTTLAAILQVILNSSWQTFHVHYNFYIPFLAKIINFLVAVAVNRHFGKHSKLKLRPSNVWMRLFMFSILVILSIAIVMFAVRVPENIIQMICVIGFLIADIMFFFFINDIVEREQAIQEDKLIQLQEKNQLAYYQSMENYVSEQLSITHDYRNQILCIEGLLQKGDYEQAETYVEQILGDWRDIVHMVNTNHAVMNSILNQKILAARQKGISLILKIDDLSDLPIQENDAVILFTNLIDNGIEACMRLETTEKLLKLQIEKKHGEWMISTQNPIEKLPHMKGNYYKSSKERPEMHGIGMKNIEKIIKKYRGEDLIQCSENSFLHIITIPLSE